MDKIFIQQLKIETLIGIHPHEREQKQVVMIDLEMEVSTTKAAKTDDIDDALNYDNIIDFVIKLTQVRQFNLIEALSDYIAEHLINEFGVSWLRLCLTKPSASHTATAVGIIIERKPKLM